MSLPRTAAFLALLAVAAPGLAAQRDTVRAAGVPGDTLPVFTLAPMVVEGRSENLTRVAPTASVGFVGYRDFHLRPLVREGELLETVPGVIMTQHSGDGKANQMFVRGFNLDHGTDFATVVDGMPVNLPTHAHGQGYTDLNFLIPELVDQVEYQLGPYYADIGDFGAAGGARLRLKRRLDRPFTESSLGAHGFGRIVAAGSTRAAGGELLAGGEAKSYDGPWLVPEGDRKLSGLLRYSWTRGQSLYSVLGLGYDGRWNASDQIPRRLVQRGQLSRFGQVDTTLGGTSYRYSLSGSWLRATPGSSQSLDLYGILYDLSLFSDFTYFLDDPRAGDQIQQRDRGRKVVGLALTDGRTLGRHRVTTGLQLRLDRFDVGLLRTHERRAVAPVRSDRGTETSSGAYAQVESRWTSSLRTVLGLRGDAFTFDVSSNRPLNSGSTSAGIVSPKASLIWTPDERAELYVSGGLGFHSNDARGAVQMVDPITGEAVHPVDPLVRSRGGEVGFRLTPGADWRTTVSAWAVDLASELVFVGDAGTTEPSAASRHEGVTIANFARLTPSLTADVDFSLARARFRDVARGDDRIPGALENVVTAGLTREPRENGPFAALRLRRFGDYPLIEDDSRRAPSTSLVNMNAGWALGRLRVGASVLNVLDSAGSDIEYFYASRLPGEPVGGVEDVHFHPVEPRQLRLVASWGL